ncbi:unnamed protein product, partial [Allacma fusca]
MKTAELNSLTLTWIRQLVTLCGAKSLGEVS